MKRNLFAGRPRSGGFSLNVFTEAEIDDIHLATLEVLERTGVFVEADEAIDIFSDAGCRVDREKRDRQDPAARRRGRRSARRRASSCSAAAIPRTTSSWSRAGSRSPTSARVSVSSIPFTGEYRD